MADGRKRKSGYEYKNLAKIKQLKIIEKEKKLPKKNSFFTKQGSSSVTTESQSAETAPPTLGNVSSGVESDNSFASTSTEEDSTTL